MDTASKQQSLLEWKQSMENFVINDIRVSLNQDMLEVGLIILTMVGIDCISGYLAGKPADTNTFKQFVTSKYFPTAYHTVADDLFQLRNGLVHDYTSKNNMFEFSRREGEGAPHLQTINAGQRYPISLNRETFAKDFLRAWERYSKDVFEDEDLAQRTLARILQTGRGFLIVRSIPQLAMPTDQRIPRGNEYRGGTVNWPGS